MNVSILSLATAVPPYGLTQEQISDKLVDILSLEPEKAKLLKQIHQNSMIKTRYSVLQDFTKDRKEWNFWGAEFPKKIPGMASRNDVYKKEAPILALEACIQALEAWGGNLQDITHIISVSCTGMIAPGIEFDLMQRLELNPATQRLGINFMGCFGAFKGLSVAQAYAKENPQNRILLICTELCSLHFQIEPTPDNILANSLFSDGAAAAVIGAAPQPTETPLWTIRNSRSLGLEKTSDKMSWEAGDHGFVMQLSHTVPVLLGRQIGAFVDSLTGPHFSADHADWAIHPGGKSIIQAIERALHLKEGATQASWDTLANYGNMSSATFLFVLKRLFELRTANPWAVGIGFGPGLSVEGILLSKNIA